MAVYMSTVERLKEMHRSNTLTYEHKLDFKAKGKPVPIFQFEGKRQCRLPEVYNREAWICGCEVQKALFCFPCFIFKHNSTAWSSNGITDLANLSNHVKKHNLSPCHVSAVTSLALLGKIRINEALDEGAKVSRMLHNREVDRNRVFFKHHIQAAIFLVKQGLGFRGNDERLSSANRGNYIELLTLLAKVGGNADLLRVTSAPETEASATFTGLSPDIQNDIIHSIHTVALRELQHRVGKASYVSIMADESTDISNSSQLSVSIRLEHNGQVREHFVDMVDVSDDRTAATLAQKILDSLERCIRLVPGGTTDIVGQSYDGAPNMAGKHNSVQTIVQHTWPNATYTHCYAHKWNLVIRSACKDISLVVTFFGFLQNVAHFFRASPKRATMLSSVIPTSCPTRWLTRGKSVQAVSANFVDIKNTLEGITISRDFDSSTRAEAQGLYHQLTCSDNVFLLLFFKRLFGLSDIVSKRLQSRNIDPGEIGRKIADYKSNIDALRSDEQFHAIYDEMMALEPTFPRRRKANARHDRDSGFTTTTVDETSAAESLKAVSYEVIDTLKCHLDVRFGDVGKLEWITLFQPHRFEYFRTHSRKAGELIECLMKQHPDLVPDKVAFQVQLQVLYSDTDVRTALESVDNNDTFDLLSSLVKLELHEALPTVYKAITAALTMALTSVACERIFSVLRRVKNYTRSTTGQNRLTQLMFLAVENELVKELSLSPRFFDDVIDVFAQMKERRLKLIYTK